MLVLTQYPATTARIPIAMNRHTPLICSTRIMLQLCTLLVVMLALFPGEASADLDRKRAATLQQQIDAEYGGDLQKAVGGFKAGCDAGKASHCYFLGLEFVVRATSEDDPTTALQYFRRACDADYQPGCFQWAMVRLPLDKSDEHAMVSVMALNRSCLDTQYALSCDFLELLASPFPEAYLANAEPQLRQACSKKLGIACYLIGTALKTMHGSDKKYQQEITGLYQQSCDAGYGQGCFHLGLQILSSGKLFASKEQEARVAVEYGRACELGYLAGCVHQAIYYMYGGNDVPRALGLYDQACRAGDASACGDVAKIYLDGKKVSADRAKAAAYYQLACDIEDQPEDWRTRACAAAKKTNSKTVTGYTGTTCAEPGVKEPPCPLNSGCHLA